jgi:hypothetical protein
LELPLQLLLTLQQTYSGFLYCGGVPGAGAKGMQQPKPLVIEVFSVAVNPA